jgi:hypothetical protein
MKIITPHARTAQSQSSKDLVALRIEFEVAGLSPRHVRHRFANSLRIAIAKARIANTIDQAVCEELWRVVPAPERA